MNDVMPCDEEENMKLHKRRLMSKYDAVKVYVWIPGTPPHSYVLSRYVIARMLSVAKIPYTKAVKMALRLKKALVDREILNVSQEELETCLREQLERKQYGMEYFQRLKFVNRFFQEKRRMVITICGAPSVGKSTFAQQLATRFNLPTVLQTDLIYQMMCKAPESPFLRPGIYERSSLLERELLLEYDRECLMVRRAIAAETQQMMDEGKVLVMEGVHLDPGLYLSEFAQLGGITYPYGTPPTSPSCMSHSTQDDGSSAVSHESELDVDGSQRFTKPIVYIPIVVTASAHDHRLQARDAIYRTGSRFFSPQTEQSGSTTGDEALLKWRTWYPNQSVAIVNVGLSEATEELDQLHDHFLKCISLSMQL